MYFLHHFCGIKELQSSVQLPSFSRYQNRGSEKVAHAADIPELVLILLLPKPLELSQEHLLFQKDLNGFVCELAALSSTSFQ